MSILSTLNTAASGLAAHGDALGVVGDNIANANTIGFKRSRGQFEDVLGVAAGRVAEGGGAGSRLAHVEQMWAQGALLSTESPTDLALTGDGFFVVKGNADGVDGNFYTRAGQFHIDKEGFLSNPDGMRLQGYAADDRGNLTARVSDLSISSRTLPATPTEKANMAVNLDSKSEQPPAWDPTDPGTTSNFSSGLTVYDSLGNAHDLTVYFRKSGANSWEWHAMADGAEMSGGTPGVPTEGASGTLSFTTSGALDTETVNQSQWDFTDATAGQAIAFDFGKSITGDGGTGFDGTTQFGSASSTSGIQQDGFAAGSVEGISISTDGAITGVFSNGQKRTLAQVVVADFKSVDGLARVGRGLWSETRDSGEPLIGAAQSGGRGAIVAGALEQSNVDIGREFVDLIAYQRGFQANAKVVQTADEMYGELVNLRR